MVEAPVTAGMVTIPVEEYMELLDDSRFLGCLQNAGVDNWEGYEFAIEEYQEGKDA